MSMELADQVDAIVRDCLCTNEEVLEAGGIPKGAVIAQGVWLRMGYNPLRLEQHREEVREILNRMPVQFHAKTGGGWSFLNLCMDKDGNQLGEHFNVDELLTLAFALGLGRFTMPRELWSSLPGGMPYVVFDTTGGSGCHS